jgi:hypothetical protein
MIDTLVLSGTGLNLVSLIGVFKAFEKNNVIKNIKNIYCNSGSSIIAFMIGLGLNSSEMLNILKNYEIKKEIY